MAQAEPNILHIFYEAQPRIFGFYRAKGTVPQACHVLAGQDDQGVQTPQGHVWLVVGLEEKQRKEK